MNQAKKSNTTTAIPLSSDRTSFNSFCLSLSGLEQSYEWRAISRNSAKRLTGIPHEIFDSLEGANQAGYDIFVTINETDGKDIKGANVTQVRALFADFDGSPLSNLDRIPLKPSFTVNTSPGKHHAYWLIDDCPLDQSSINQ